MEPLFYASAENDLWLIIQFETLDYDEYLQKTKNCSILEILSPKNLSKVSSRSNKNGSDLLESLCCYVSEYGWFLNLVARLGKNFFEDIELEFEKIKKWCCK